MPSPIEIEAERAERRPLPARGSTCYGYEVRTDLAMRYLRPGPAPSSLEISEVAAVEPPAGEPIRRWIPTREHPFDAELHREGEIFKLWARGTGWYVIDPRIPAIMVPRDADPVRREERLWGFPAALCFITRRDLPLHAASVDVGGRSLLLAAPGRYGKTTLAASFLRLGHRLLSEDITCCRLDEQPTVLPGPAMLRMRPDAYARLDLPGTNVVGTDDERVHLELEEAARGDGSPVPLLGIVLLRKADGHPSLERITAMAAMQDLWSLSFKLPTDEDRARSFRAVADVAGRVPIWNLSRPLRYDELDDVVHLLTSTCLDGG